MTTASIAARSDDRWLSRYYLVRAAFSVCWVALAFTVGRAVPPLAVALMLAYPAWDGVANWYDARRNGGLAANPTQSFNALVSALVTAAVAVTVAPDFHAVVGVIGVWASLSGLLQLATGVRRWRSASAQWPMILSGAQSALAGAFMLKQAGDKALSLDIAAIAPYAAFGALYFALSGLILLVRTARQPRVTA